jgi:hypothetical protein
MTSDYRIKYINSLIGNSSNIDSSLSPDSLIYNNDTDVGVEAFEGGIHINNARKLFILFAALIIILYILGN